MKLAIILCLCLTIAACSNSSDEKAPVKAPVKIIFLHHSTGLNIWNGDVSSLKFKVGNIYRKITDNPNMEAALPTLFKEYNQEHATNFQIEEKTFPKEQPYGWNNYPFDYYNIWVKHGGETPFMEEPTLELLTREYDIIMFKHCFPTSNIQPDLEVADINSDYKSIANYKLQYNALKEKMHQFPKNTFIVWTGAAQVESQISVEEATRAKEFFTWVVKDWDKPGDNIFVWDFYSLETDGSLFLKPEKATGNANSHPNKAFSNTVAPTLRDFVIDTYNSGK